MWHFIYEEDIKKIYKNRDIKLFFLQLNVQRFLKLILTWQMLFKYVEMMLLLPSVFTFYIFLQMLHNSFMCNFLWNILTSIQGMVFSQKNAIMLNICSKHVCKVPEDVHKYCYKYNIENNLENNENKLINLIENSLSFC